MGIGLVEGLAYSMGRCEVYRRISYEVCGCSRKASQENGSGAAINNGKWIVGGLNATDKPLTLTLNLPMFAGKTVEYLTDQPKKQGEKFYTSVKKTLKVGKNGKAKVVIQPNGGIIIN